MAVGCCFAIPQHNGCRFFEVEVKAAERLWWGFRIRCGRGVWLLGKTRTVSWRIMNIGISNQLIGRVGPLTYGRVWFSR